MAIGLLLHSGMISNRHINDGDGGEVYSYTTEDDQVIDFTELWNEYNKGFKIVKTQVQCNSIFLDFPEDEVCVMPLIRDYKSGKLKPQNGFLIPLPAGSYEA